jgi:hypothetical protein
LPLFSSLTLLFIVFSVMFLHFLSTLFFADLSIFHVPLSNLFLLYFLAPLRASFLLSLPAYSSSFHTSSQLIFYILSFLFP